MAVCSFFLLAFGFTFYAILLVRAYISDKEIFDELVKIIKNRIVLAIILISLLGSLIPSKEEMYLIYASSYITKENFNLTKGEIKEGIDYIFKKIDEAKNKN